MIVSGLLTPSGPTGRLLQLWFEGAFELVTCNQQLVELKEVLSRPKFSSRVTAGEVDWLIKELRDNAEYIESVEVVTGVTDDPGDDYLIALALAGHVEALIASDRDLTELKGSPVPVIRPAAVVKRLDN